MAASPSGRDAHLDRPLTNVAVKAFQGSEGYIAQALMPIVNVGKQSDKYYTIDKDSWLRIDTTYRAPKTSPRRTVFEVSSDAYHCDNYALAEDNALEDLANADTALQLRQNTTDHVTEMLLRDYENRVASLVTSGTNLGSYVSLTNKWDDEVNGDPLGDVNTGRAFMMDNTGIEPNTLVIDWKTLQEVRKHPQLLDLFKYTEGGLVSEAQLKSAFMVQNVLVAKGIKQNALLHGTSSLTTIWGNNVILAHVKPGLSLKTATFGLSFRWTPAGIPGPLQAYRYLDPDPGKKAETIEVSLYQDEKIIAKDLSYGILATL